MSKRMMLVATCVIIFATIIVFMVPLVTNPHKSLKQMVTEKGPPILLATRTEIKQGQVKTLNSQVPAVKPRTITNWNEVKNVTAIWGGSEWCQFEVGFYYDNMKRDKDFDGTYWLSSRSWFFREKLT